MDTNDMMNDGYGSELVNTREETDKKCPACGGIMEYEPSSGMLLCPFCDNKEEIEVKDPGFVAEEIDFYEAEEEASCDWGVATKSVICKACGAETVYDVNEIAGACPYCGSNQVMDDPNTKKIMAPGGVLPFKIDAAKASEEFKKWIGKKFFCPKLAKESAKPDAFNGVYVPFWTFDADTESRYQGEYGTEHQRRDRDGNMRTEIRWHRTSGHISKFFDDVLVCGSAKQSESIVNGLEPYDTKQTVEYKPEYMAGFKAERYTVKMKAAWEKAKNKIASILRSDATQQIRAMHGTSHTRNVSVATSYSNITYKYLLLPIWISAFQYNGKVYQFMVNGQTGKVSGRTPISWIKVGLTVLAVIAVLIILNWLFG